MSDTSIKDFEAAMAERESIVKKLEEGGLPREQSLVLYERSAQLSRVCHARLEAAPADAVSRHAPPEAAAFAFPAACAVEFIHTYSLIHDDLPAMDNDKLRRGRPTLHVVYGDGLAILAGDALQAEAFALLAREPRAGTPDLSGRKLRALQAIAEAAGACGMVGGQGIDLQAAGQAIGHTLTLD